MMQPIDPDNLPDDQAVLTVTGYRNTINEVFAFIVKNIDKYRDEEPNISITPFRATSHITGEEHSVMRVQIAVYPPKDAPFEETGAAVQ